MSWWTPAGEGLLLVAALAAGYRARRWGAGAPPPASGGGRLAAALALAALACILAAYVAADPRGAWFYSGMSNKLEAAEACVFGGRCPLRGPDAGGMLDLGPLYYYLLMPGVAAGHGSGWMLILSGLGLLSGAAVLALLADRLYGFPAGIVAAGFLAATAAPECRHDPRHAPLAVPVCALILLGVERWWRSPTARLWLALCAAFWVGLQFHLSVATLLPLLVFLAPRHATPRELGRRLLVLVAVGLAFNAPLLADYWRAGLSPKDPTLRPAAVLDALRDWVLAPSMIFALGGAGVASALLLGGRERARLRVPIGAMLLVAAAYAPALRLLQPRFLFPWWTAWALTSGAAAAALWRLAMSRQGASAGAAAAGLAAVFAVSLAGSMRSIRVDSPEAATLEGLAALLDGLPARRAAALELHGPIAPSAASALEYLWWERARRARTAAPGEPPLRVVYEPWEAGLGRPALVPPAPGCLDYENARLKALASGEERALELPLRRSMLSHGMGFNDGRRQTLAWLRERLRAGERAWRVSVPLRACSGPGGRRRYAVLLDAGAALRPAAGATLVRAARRAEPGSPGSQVLHAVLDAAPSAREASFDARLDGGEPPEVLDVYEAESGVPAAALWSRSEEEAARAREARARERLERAKSLFGGGRRREARRELDAAARLAAGEALAREVARAYRAQDVPSEAISLLERFAGRGSPGLRLELAEALVDVGRAGEASGLAPLAARLGEEQRRRLARVLQAAGGCKEALGAWRKAAAGARATPSDLAQAGGCERQAGDARLAAADAERGARARPAGFAVNLSLAETLGPLGRRAAAAAALRRAAPFARDDPERVLVARSFRRLGLPREALAALGPGGPDAAATAAVEVERGEALAALGRAADARAAFGRAESAAADAQTAPRLAAAIEALDGCPRALVAWRKAAGAGASWESAAGAAACELAAGDPRAAAAVDAAERAAPQTVDAQLRLAELFAKAGRRDRALEALRKVAPRAGEQSVRLAAQLRALGAASESVAILERAARPSDGEAQSALAGALLELGRREEAVQALERAGGAARDPRALRDAARLLIGLGARAEALRALSRSPDPGAALDRGELLAESDRPGDAAAALERAGAASLPPEELRRLARAWQRLDRCPRALSVWRSLAAHHPQVPKDLSDRAVCEYLSGDERSAVADLLEALRRAPALADAYVSLATIEVRRGRPREAVRLCERALAACPASDSGRILEALAAARRAAGEPAGR